jgi:hypothetical protein
MPVIRSIKIVLTSLFLAALFSLVLYTCFVSIAQGRDSDPPVRITDKTELQDKVIQYRTQKGDEVCYITVAWLHGWTVTSSCFQRKPTIHDWLGEN